MTNLMKIVLALALTSFLAGARRVRRQPERQHSERHRPERHEAERSPAAATRRDSFALAALGGTLVFNMRRKAKAAA